MKFEQKIHESLELDGGKGSPRSVQEMFDFINE